MNALHLWLIRHGIEFEGGEQGMVMRHQRHLCIVINHRYYGIDVGIDFFRGVFTDELHTPHAEIAAERQRLEQEHKP